MKGIPIKLPPTLDGNNSSDMQHKANDARDSSWLYSNRHTRVIWKAAVLLCGKQMEKLPHYYFSWIVSFQKRDKCKMLPLETKHSRGKLLSHLNLQQWNVSRGTIMQYELQHWCPPPSQSLFFFAACTPHFIPTSFILSFVRIIFLNKDETSPKCFAISMHIMFELASTSSYYP